MSVKITPAEFTATVAKIAKINERAVKRGFTGRLEVKGERVETTTKDALGFDVTEIWYDTEITGEAPSYNGWTFLARVDRVEDTFTVATAPGVTHVDRDQVRPGVCDHCGFDRRRNNTYVVVNDTTGQIVNVGSTCIKDFLGWSASVVFFGERDVEREIGGYTHEERTYSVDTVLAYAYAATRAFGFVSTSSYDGCPTADLVRLGLGMYRPNEKDRAVLATLSEYAAEATEQAATIRAFILSEDFAGNSTYVDNLKVAVSVQGVTNRQVGLLASAPQAYTRHLERQAGIEAAKATAKVSDYIGQVKDKVQVEGTIKSIRFIDGQYGTTVLYTILTTEGNLVKWFASREALGTQEGRTVTITGTIKGHEEYQGTKSTVLTRCKELTAA